MSSFLRCNRTNGMLAAMLVILCMATVGASPVDARSESYVELLANAIEEMDAGRYATAMSILRSEWEEGKK